MELFKRSDYKEIKSAVIGLGVTRFGFGGFIGLMVGFNIRNPICLAAYGAGMVGCLCAHMLNKPADPKIITKSERELTSVLYGFATLNAAFGASVGLLVGTHIVNPRTKVVVGTAAFAACIANDHVFKDKLDE